jgi:cell division protein ZapA
MKQLEVTILGQSYLLACLEGGEKDLREAVSRVDHEMSVIRDAGKVKARERIAVLAALNLAYALAGNTAPQTVPLPTRSTPPQEGAIESLIQRLDQALGADGQLL